MLKIFTRWAPGLSGCALACLLALGACETKEKATEPDPTNKIPGRTGLNGADNVGTIPQNVSFTSSFFGNQQLPARIDLQELKKVPPIGNQGSFGTCVAWAVGYNAKTILEAVKFDLTEQQLAQPQYQLSALDLFTAIPDADKGADNCEGSNFVPALEVMLNRGVATKAVAPYSGFTNCRQTNVQPAWSQDAAKHKIERYRRIDFTAAAVKQELARKNPVILGAKLADNFMSWNTDAVYQNHDAFGQVGIHSYHAMCIVGYDDAKGPNGAFKVVNSWDTNWGSQGVIWVDYNFMFNGFCFNNNLFVASNDDQRPTPGPNPNPGPNPQPDPTGVDLVPWVFADTAAIDYQNQVYTRNRTMFYDLYNIGNQAAPAAQRMQFAYIYYNAYNANDYGIIFINRMDPSLPVNNPGNPAFTCATVQAHSECRINVAVPPDGSIASAVVGQANAYLFQNYPMPVINGDYYLVMIADVSGKFAEEDEDNNLFYVTDQEPKRFINGTAERHGAPTEAWSFRNRLAGPKPYALPRAADYHTAVKPGRRNAYSPGEILALLQDRVASGEFAQKLRAHQAFRQAHPDAFSAGVVRR